MFDLTKLAHRALVCESNMRLPYICVMIKHVALPAGSSTMCLDNIFLNGLPDLVVTGFLSNTAFAGSYRKSPYNFKNFKIKQMDLFSNGMSVPRFGYQPNFTKKIYNSDNFTFQEQLELDQGDHCVNLTLKQRADGFNLYSFKISNGPIGRCTANYRSHAETGSVRLEFNF